MAKKPKCVKNKKENQRTYNGKVYKGAESYYDKRNARNAAEFYRNHGKQARVVPAKHRGSRVWRIFTRKKKRGKA